MKLTTVFISVGLWAQPIPKTWDDARIATHEVPLAHTVSSPKHVSSDYYYRIPVRPIFKGYPVYAPDHEPPDYMEWLMKQEPVILWDDRRHVPPLKTEADWIRAGQMVFDSGLTGNRLFRIQDVRNPAWYEKLGVPVARVIHVRKYRWLFPGSGAHARFCGSARSSWPRIPIGRAVVSARFACSSRTMPILASH